MKAKSLLTLLILIMTTMAVHAAKPTAEWSAKIEKIAPEKPTAKPVKKHKALIFSLMTGYKHAVTPFTTEMLTILGKKTGAYDVVASDDIKMFEPENIKPFDIIILNNTCSIGGTRDMFFDVTKDKKAAAALEKSLIDHIAKGNGLAVMHGGIVMQNNSAEFSKMLGGSFDFHPKQQEITGLIVDPKHPLTQPFNGKPLVHKDEPYLFMNAYKDMNFRPLLEMDTEKLDCGKRMDAEKVKSMKRYIAWIKPYKKGRVFYCSPSHNAESFENPALLHFILNGVQYAAGDLKCDDTPLAGSTSDLPTLSRAELADLLERQETRLQSLRAHYSIKKGDVEGTESEQILQQIPVFSDKPYWSMNFGKDFKNGNLHIVEQTWGSDKPLTRKFAFDGKRWMRQTQNQPGEDKWNGGITKEKPSGAPDSRMLFSPFRLGYNVLYNTPASTLIRDGEKVQISTGSFDGLPCYVVYVLYGVESKVMFKGREVLGKRDTLHKIFFAPTYGMLPVRVDKLNHLNFILKQMKASPGKPTPQLSKLSLSTIIERVADETRRITVQRKIEEVEKGMFFAREIDVCGIASNRDKQSLLRVSVESISVNGDALIAGELDFPPLTNVKDEIRGLKYRTAIPQTP